MPSDPAARSKRDALRRNGTLNPHPDVVTDPLFRTGDFFDPHDSVQLKYEMLRRVRVDKQSVSQSASAFGFSRPTFYQAEEDFQRDGLSGLLPGKRGAAPVKATNLLPRFWTSLSNSGRAIQLYALRIWLLPSRSASP